MEGLRWRKVTRPGMISDDVQLALAATVDPSTYLDVPPQQVALPRIVLSEKALEVRHGSVSKRFSHEADDGWAGSDAG